MQLEYSEKMDAFYRGQHIEPFQPHLIDSGVAQGVVPFGSPVQLVSISENYLAEQVKVLDDGAFRGVAVLVDGVEQDAYVTVTSNSSGLGIGGEDTLTEAVAGFKDKAPLAIMKTGRVVVALDSTAVGSEVVASGSSFGTGTAAADATIKCIVHRAADTNGLGIIEMFRV
jgi:hypothetical protein